MSSRVERFKKRQRIKRTIESRTFESTAQLVDQEDVNALLNQVGEDGRIERLTHTTELEYTFTEDPQEVQKTLETLRVEFNHARYEKLINEMRRDVLTAIAGPLGLGKILAVYDKNGGNVTTIHNAKQGIYAKDADGYNRDDYDRSKNSEGKQFAGAGKNSAGANYTRSQMDDQGMVQDEYTGRSQKAQTTSPDHVKSLKEYHTEGGFMQNKMKKADFATDEGNLAMTDRSINQSMQDTDKDVWMKKTSTKDKTATNAEYYDVDERAVREAVERGEKTAKKHLPTKTEKAKYYFNNSVSTGIDEGAKMGSQQALGLLVVEFFSQAFHEISLAFNEGLEGDGLIDDLKIRFKRIAKAVSAKWKDVIKAFSGGFISGFISNLITVAINMVKTTSARVVRLIREGIYSLLKAVKIILFRPEGVTRSEALHSAVKIIFAGGILVGGIALEESIATFMGPFGSLAAGLTAAIVGFMTVLATALVTYLLDKRDVFNAVQIEQNKFVIGRLGDDIESSLSRSETIAQEMDQYLLPA